MRAPAAQSANRVGQTNDGQEGPVRGVADVWAGSGAEIVMRGREAGMTGPGSRSQMALRIGSAAEAIRAMSHILYLMTAVRDRSSLTAAKAPASKSMIWQLQVKIQPRPSREKEMI